MRIVVKARNDMPMQVRREIAQTGKIDLVRRELFTQHRLNRKHHLHTVRAVCGSQISHFRDMRCPDHTAIAWIIRLIDEHDAAAGVFP